MGGHRKCSVLGCYKSTGLHVFPSDAKLLRQWLRACGRDENEELSPRAGVCDEHFTSDAYNNLAEFKMGFCKHLRLLRNAVPTLCLPRAQKPSQPLILPRLDIDSKSLHLPRLECKGPVDSGCQTDRVLTMHAYVQADRRPPFRSKAIQARMPSRSVECSTMTLTEDTEANLVKRKRCEGPDSSCAGGSDNNNCTSKEVPPQKSQFIVEEDKLMELFVWCPICSNRCEVSKIMTQTLLCVKQQCTYCHFTNEWFSHS